MISNRIIDGRGRGNEASVSDDGALNVFVSPHPPEDDEVLPIPFRQYFTDDGTSAGSNDMRVDGSSTPQTFFICANEEFDTYINSCSVVISDAGASLSQFGSISALTNGIKLSWSTQARGEIVIHEALTTNFEFVRLGGGVPAFGNGNTAFRANNVSGSSEAYIPFIDFQEIFGMTWGLKLRKGTLDCVTFTVRDDITNIDQMDVIAYGISF